MDLNILAVIISIPFLPCVHHSDIVELVGPSPTNTTNIHIMHDNTYSLNDLDLGPPTIQKIVLFLSTHGSIYGYLYMLN